MRLLVAALMLLVFAAPAAAKPKGTWLAGDMHVHTCYSHDAYCGPGDDNTGPDTFYSSGGTVEERFIEAAAKGLDFLNISDHNDIRAWTDPGFGTHGVVGLHSYEASLPGGHAHAIGIDRLFDPNQPIQALADAIHADGGLFQANHPAYRATKVPQTCAQMQQAGDYMDWQYGFDVTPDTLEVWNPTASLDVAERYWECWLDRGVKIPATPGSDTHGALMQVGTPTTFVFSRSRSEADIEAGIASGRTTLSRTSPTLGGTRLLLQSGSKMVGDTVHPGASMQVRADGVPGGALVRVRANGRTIVDDAPLLPGQAVKFKAPGPGWVRAILYAPEPLAQQDPGCSPNDSPISLCSHDLEVVALTSPLYVR
jgi:hypothetical protein